MHIPVYYIVNLAVWSAIDAQISAPLRHDIRMDFNSSMTQEMIDHWMMNQWRYLHQNKIKKRNSADDLPLKDIPLLFVFRLIIL